MHLFSHCIKYLYQNVFLIQFLSNLGIHFSGMVPNQQAQPHFIIAPNGMASAVGAAGNPGVAAGQAAAVAAAAAAAGNPTQIQPPPGGPPQ